mgnify:CR=1 FL=1
MKPKGFVLHCVDGLEGGREVDEDLLLGGREGADPKEMEVEGGFLRGGEEGPHVVGQFDGRGRDERQLFVVRMATRVLHDVQRGDARAECQV